MSAHRFPLWARGVALGLALVALPPGMAWAGPGHDHDAPAALAAGGDSPRRGADGRVFLPKAAQRQLALRTVAVAEGDWPRVFELPGQVVMDPQAGGRVQAALAGRLEPGPRGLPTLGQAVRQGEVLAYVVPTSGALEQSAQQAQQAELRAAQALAERRLARLRELADTVPAKDIEAAASERDSLAARLAALDGGLARRDALRAPVSGVIASTQAVAGQVLEARELVFEVIDPRRLRIEALAYDPAQAATVVGGSLGLGEERVPLRFVGAGRVLRAQALPLVFDGGHRALAGLALGQPVPVLAESSQRVRGLAVPRLALQKNAANQAIVWVKQGAEQFEPRPVVVAPLDAATVVLTSGLRAGERVVTQGASLLNQVR